MAILDKLLEKKNVLTYIYFRILRLKDDLNVVINSTPNKNIELIKERLNMNKKVIFQLDKDLVKEMEKIRDETGFPISRQINLKLKGYKIIKEELNNV